MSPDLPTLVPDLDHVRCTFCGAGPFHTDIKDGVRRAWVLHTKDRDTGAPCPGADLLEGHRYLLVPQPTEGDTP